VGVDKVERFSIMIVQISERWKKGSTTYYTKEIECDWVQVSDTDLVLLLDLAGGSWTKAWIPLSQVLSIRETKHDSVGRG